MRTSRKTFLATSLRLLGLAAWGGWTAGAEETAPKGNRQGPKTTPGLFHTGVPPGRGHILLCRPTDQSITLGLFLAEPAGIRIGYNPLGTSETRQTGIIDMKAGEPREIVLAQLRPHTAYEYRVLDARSGQPLPDPWAGGTFQTGRPAGSEYTFTVHADSHLDENCIPALYANTLSHAKADRPDFHLDLGDTFMSGKHPDRASAALQYAAQRHYLGQIGQTVPLFFCLGNHDGEEAKKAGARDADGLAVWSCLQRKRVIPNPEPGGFYSGNAQAHPHAGLLQNYYSWTWGDALLVVLDPYWTSASTRGGDEPWNMSIGKSQYDWLAQTLRQSGARHKLVFIHQLTTGVNAGGRGGVEAARFHEWGGLEIDGTNAFATKRPGWDKPIHQLLVETGVRIVFHGHDHFFARQELDGVVYQLAPQPGHRNCTTHSAKEYGYLAGDLLPNSGHLRIRVSPDNISVEYIRSALPEMARLGARDGEVAYRYTLGRA